MTCRCLFFRPSPSRLSPGRNTVFVPVERIVQCLASFPLWGVKREDLYAVQVVQVRCKNRKQTTRTKRDHKQTNRKNHIIAVDKSALCEFQQLMC